ncbi:MAG: hypothetical protein O7D91_15960 [Planctomycetota bacterium]|nr:hypothetical protein [Planctomycetota bacterium]
MASSNEGDPPRKQSPKIIPQGPDDFIGIAAWLWCRLSLDPQFYASALNPGVVCDYTELLARESGWLLHEMYPLFWHCYKASQSNVRQYITCDLPYVEPQYVGRAAKWLERHHVSFDEDGRQLFKWLQDRHPDLSKELEAVIERARRQDPQYSEDSAGEDGATSAGRTGEEVIDGASAVTSPSKDGSGQRPTVDLDSTACAFHIGHPEWTMTSLAQELDCSRPHLYRLPMLTKLRELLKTGKFNLPAGTKYPDGSVEAFKSNPDVRTCPACREEHTFVCPECAEDERQCPVCHIQLRHANDVTD